MLFLYRTIICFLCSIFSLVAFANGSVDVMMGEFAKTIEMIEDPANNSRQYALLVESDDPCSVTLEERYRLDHSQWVRRYDVNLYDLRKDALFSGKNNRRVIVYNAQVVKETGEARKFPPKRINNIGLMVDPAVRKRLIDQLNKLVRYCEKEHPFLPGVDEVPDAG